MRNRWITYSSGVRPFRRSPILPAGRCSIWLRRGSQPCRTDSEAALFLSRPAISKHLRLASPVAGAQERREGRQWIYRLNPGPLKAVDSWLERYRVFWQANLSNLKAFVEAEYVK